LIWESNIMQEEKENVVNDGSRGKKKRLKLKELNNP
jgi:hypothetical protein